MVFLHSIEGERVLILFTLGDCVVFPQGIEIFLCKGHQNSHPKDSLLFTGAPSHGSSHTCLSQSDDSLFLLYDQFSNLEPYGNTN